jgi:beta-N-acetylhexosaminidase
MARKAVRTWSALLLVAMLAAATAVHASEGEGEGGGAIDRLSPGQLVGERLIVSYQGLDPPKRLLHLIRRGAVAGVILFGGNTGFEPPDFHTERGRVKKAITRMQRARRRARPRVLARSPLLVMVDQEGGLVRRLGGQPSDSEREIGKSHQGERLAREAGFGAANNGSGVGVNVNLAPVLAVLSKGNGDGFLGQFQRAYGFDRDKVARLGERFVEASRNRGVAATAKHFPGLGAAKKNQDTDVRPVTLNIPLHTLRKVDEHPYPSALEAGVDMVLLSNAYYPALDRGLPASMSPTVIREELRSRLGFRGVTITDAIEAGGLRRVGNLGRRAVQGVRAGEDLLLFAGQSLDEATEAARAVRRALRNGRVPRANFERSARRVIGLRREIKRGLRW